MATTIEQQVALDEALVPSIKRLRIGRSNFRLPSDIQSKESTLQVVYDVLRRSPFFKAFLVTADVPEIYMQEFWATSYVHQHSIRLKMDTRKNIVDLEEEILDFLQFLGHSAQIKTLSDVVSRHQNTQQYGAILPIELTTKDIRNTKAYKEYHACATGEAAPKPKGSARRKRGGSNSSTTPPTAIASLRPITTVAAAPRLTAAAKGTSQSNKQETHISQHGGSSTNEGTSSKLRVPDVPSDDLEEEISWNSSDDEDVDAQDKGRDDDEGKKNDESDDGQDDDDDDQDNAERDDDDDDDDDEEEIAKLDEQEDTESGEGDAEETENSEDDGNSKEDQGLRVSEEQRLIEEEKVDELYRDVDINQGRGLQVSQDIEDSHVTITPVNPDGQKESSSVSSFVTNMLNPISDAGVESIFTTASSPIAPLQTSIPIMTPSTIATITTSSDAPIPPTTILSAVLQNLLTFDSVFHFKERVKSLEVNFSEFMQTNQFAEAVYNIL
nr:hypothetical protein [Tanacetum cinerariifolium]